jgi:hypothetical protein
VNDSAVGVELGRRVAGVVRELLDQVFVGVAQLVLGHVGHRQSLGRKVLDQVLQRFVGQALAVGPRRVAEDAVEQIRVGGLNGTHGLLDGGTDVLGRLAYVVPVRALRDLEAVVLGELRAGEVAARVGQRRLVLLVPDI